jgi:hypothetical protein
MTLPIPLTVRLKTSRKDVDVTAQIGSLTFRSTIPGGFASASITLNKPISLQPDEIAYFGKMYVYDGRNGMTVWEGRVEDPGRTADASGTVWGLSAIGPSAHASDRTYPIIYVDTSTDRWERSQYSTKNGITEVSEIDSDTPCLQVRAEEGVTVTTSWDGDWIYRGLQFTRQTLGRVRCDHVEGGASTNYQVGLYVRTGSTLVGFVSTDPWTTSPHTLSGTFGFTNWTTGLDNCSIAAYRNVSNTTADTFAWSNFYNICVRSVVKDASGNDLTTPYIVNDIDPAQVVTDLLGRYLDQYDGPNAVIVSSGNRIPQLAYPDGITAAGIFDDLAALDPAYYWAAWETTPAGKWRFFYGPWPTHVRYDADTSDGFDSPGSASDLYNEVQIRWLDPAGKMRTTVRTSTVPVLVAAGVTRTAYIDISDELGTSANATRVGDNFLAEHQYPPNAGTLIVARPIQDLDTGRMVMPWEINPGNLIRVRGVLPRVDSLNPTARDGVTVFKVVSMDYDTSSASATLELDSYSRTVAQQLANLKNDRIRRR